MQSVFPAAIAIFETSQFGISCSYETSYKFGQGNGAIAARWQAKAGVEPPFVGRERPFFLRTMIANHEPQANKKCFDPAIFQKCWRGVGEQPTFAEQIILQSVFPAAIAIVETSQFGISCSYETSYKFRQGNGTIVARWQAKAGMEPLLPDVKDHFS